MAAWEASRTCQEEVDEEEAAVQGTVEAVAQQGEEAVQGDLLSEGAVVYFRDKRSVAGLGVEALLTRVSTNAHECACNRCRAYLRAWECHHPP
jgi:hypothetical protein